jgi:hypothetical protein
MRVEEVEEFLHHLRDLDCPLLAEWVAMTVPLDYPRTKFGDIDWGPDE